MAGGRARLGHGDLAARLGARQLDGSTRPIVIGLRFLEEVQHMLRARDSQQGRSPVVGIGERAPAADRDEARVVDFGEDHALAFDFEEDLFKDGDFSHD